MSYSYDRYETRQRRQGYSSSRRTALGYWIPLALTVTVATVGLAAWIWSERKDHDEDDYDRRGGDRPPTTYSDGGPGQPSYPRGPEGSRVEEESVITRMSGALRRTPSPQQIFDGASRRVAAGMAAAGAAVGGALSSIREEDKRDYEDHSRWSEEATMRIGESRSPARSDLRDTPASGTISATHTQGAPLLPRVNDKRKAVGIVVSAERFHLHGHHGEEDTTYIQEHASLLSHLPEYLDTDSRLFVLIYAPDLQQHPLASKAQPMQPTASLTSSYSNIGPEDIYTPNEEHQKPLSAIETRPIQSPPGSDMFQALYTQARALVEKETMIMPFVTPTGYVHLLRHIAPEIVYVQETLAGPGGDAVFHIAGWVSQVVLVVGDESGHGGLVDSEDERGALGHQVREEWWQNHSRIGLGKGVEVVDGLRLGEDWRRRVRGHD